MKGSLICNAALHCLRVLHHSNPVRERTRTGHQPHVQTHVQPHVLYNAVTVSHWVMSLASPYMHWNGISSSLKVVLMHCLTSAYDTRLYYNIDISSSLNNIIFLLRSSLLRPSTTWPRSRFWSSPPASLSWWNTKLMSLIKHLSPERGIKEFSSLLRSTTAFRCWNLACRQNTHLKLSRYMLVCDVQHFR